MHVDPVSQSRRRPAIALYSLYISILSNRLCNTVRARHRLYSVIYAAAAYSYRSSSVVVPSVCLSVGPLSTSAYCGKTADLIRSDAVCGGRSGGSKELRNVLDGVLILPEYNEDFFLGGDWVTQMRPVT